MRLWPRSLQGQVLLAIALALMLAQAFSAVLLYRAQADRREAAMVHAAAMRLFTATREHPPGPLENGGHHRPSAELFGGPRSFRLEHSAISPLRAGEVRMTEAEADLRNILNDQDIAVTDVVVTRRAVRDDQQTLRRLARRAELLHQPHRAIADKLIIAGIRKPDSKAWLVVRVVVPPYERALIVSLIGQTLLIYAVLVGAIAFILRRITRPLAALTERMEHFGNTRDVAGQLAPQGPDDVRRLIHAHNTMEAGIAALLDEKDVMLGAIGHDLKTPLAALRVRIESVEDDGERAKMAATIEDIVRSLDDILSLARVGRPSDPKEPVELCALVASVVEEYEDMGESVWLAESGRIVLPLRTTWLRRALRNLIGNALRYGKVARVSLAQDGKLAVIRIEDDGPGIAEADIDRMLEPFTRGEPSRNSETGGAGLGLTLARAIAEQHGGTLSLVNRRGPDRAISGLTATLTLPVI
jgi:signal transduction histidine kinase